MFIVSIRDCETRSVLQEVLREKFYKRESWNDPDGSRCLPDSLWRTVRSRTFNGIRSYEKNVRGREEWNGGNIDGQTAKRVEKEEKEEE